MEKKGYRLTDLLSDPVQFVFLLFAVFTLAMLIPFTYAGYIFTVNSTRDAPKNYDFPGLNDFWITGVSSIVFAVL